MTQLLNHADVAIIVDMIIECNKKTTSVVIAVWQLELINKVKALELEPLSKPAKEEMTTILQELGA